MNRIEIILGNIVNIEAEAIVNAANNTLLGGGGVDGAIHKAAGFELLNYCRNLNGCKTGEAVITPGFNLTAKYIIHTVGPVWKGGIYNEDKLLESSYKNCLSIAKEKCISSIAFPSVSTGVFNFPKKKAAEIALRVVMKYQKINNYPQKVIFVCFTEDNYNNYLEMFSIQKDVK